MSWDVAIFDLDGTLVDTAPDLTAALNRTLIDLGRPAVDVESVAHLAGEGARALLLEGLRLTGGVEMALVQRGISPFLGFYENHIAETSKVAQDVEQTLNLLEQYGVVLGICTNKPERLARKLIAELGWTDRFGQIVGGDSLKWKKPDPRPLEKCIADLGGGRAVFVGDSTIDQQTADAADVPFIGIVTPYSACGAKDLGESIIIDRFASLIPALAGLNHTTRSPY